MLTSKKKRKIVSGFLAKAHSGFETHDAGVIRLRHNHVCGGLAEQLWVRRAGIATLLICRYSGAVVYDAACLTDCSQSASAVGHQPEQQEFNDQEDREETKEEARFSFMDFPVRDVAEQLTRLDAVGLMKPLLKVPVSLLALRSCRLCLRSSLSEWCPFTAWAASGLSGTRRKTETWHQPCAPPFPSSTR